MTDKARVRLSKLMSLMLRHQPEKFGLSLDESGFVSFEKVLAALRRAKQSAGESAAAGESDVRAVVEKCEKGRFEISGDGEKIRARYGHSVAGRVLHDEVEPPEVLYHGTSPRALQAILATGLRPMKRQYVHLSSDVSGARLVGLRHCGRDHNAQREQPILLKVLAQSAHAAGTKFHQPQERVFMSESIAPQFIEILESEIRENGENF